MRRAYADTGLGQMHYHEQGEGPLLLVLHASTHSARMFSRFIPELSDEYRVVAPDLPGFGNSDPLPSDVTMVDIAQSLVDLLDELGEERGHVFGLHTGNKLGAAMGARMPGRVDRLVLCGEPHSIILDEAKRDAEIADYIEDIVVDFPETDDGSHLLKAWGHLHGRLTDSWWDVEHLCAKGVTPATIDALAEQAIATIQSRRSLAPIYAVNFEYDWGADVERIEPRTLVLELAKEAEIEAYGYQGDTLAEAVPGGTWTALDGATSCDFHRDPLWIATPTKDFLR